MLTLKAWISPPLSWPWLETWKQILQALPGGHYCGDPCECGGWDCRPPEALPIPLSSRGARETPGQSITPLLSPLPPGVWGWHRDWPAEPWADQAATSPAPPADQWPTPDRACASAAWEPNVAWAPARARPCGPRPAGNRAEGSFLLAKSLSTKCCGYQPRRRQLGAREGVLT